jgi:hypothetical protein
MAVSVIVDDDNDDDDTVTRDLLLWSMMKIDQMMAQ